MAMTQTGLAHSNSANTDIQQSPQQTPTDDTSNTTLMQLWILLAQLEVINSQFALWLNTFTIKKSTTTPDNTPGNPMNLSDAPSETTPTIIWSTPSLPNQQPAHPQLAACVSDPTGWMFLLMSPSDRHPPTVHTPLAPLQSHNQKATTKTFHGTLHGSPTCSLPLMPISYNSCRTNTIPSGHPSYLTTSHIPCPLDFRNKNDHKHVCFRTPTLCHPGPMIFWPKEDMHPP